MTISRVEVGELPVGIVAGSVRSAESAAADAQLPAGSWRAVLRPNDARGCRFSALIFTHDWDYSRDAHETAAVARTALRA